MQNTQSLLESLLDPTTPFMNGYLMKGTLDAATNQVFWDQKFVQVADGLLTFWKSKEEREHVSNGVKILLREERVSVQDKTIIRIQNNDSIRLFRAPTEVSAWKWVHIISHYCSVPPIAEGFCLKLSGGKNEFEKRFLKLSGNGILSWHVKEDSKAKGAIQVNEEEISQNEADPKLLFIQTKDRTFQFQFSNKSESDLWKSALAWHSKKPKETTSANIRNKSASE